MVVYIEYLIIDNLIIDYLLLKTTGLFLKIKLSKIRLLLASLLGALSCFAFPLIPQNLWLVNIFKIVLAILMLLIAFNKLNIRQLILSFVIMLVITYSLGGLIMHFYSAASLGSGFGFQTQIPFGVCILAAVGYSKILQILINKIFKNKKVDSFKYYTKFSHNGKCIEEICFLDSGNHLIDQESQKPITIITYDLFFRLTSITIEELLTQKIDSLKNGHYQKISTINGTGNMLVFEIDRLIISAGSKELIFNNAPIGVTNAKIKTKFNCAALLNAQLMET